MNTTTRALAVVPVLSVFLVAATPAQAAQPFSTASSTVTADVQEAAFTLPPWPVLWKGSPDASFPVTVRSLQYLLNAHGARISVDGVFGSATDAAVRAYQRTHGLAVDGVVGGRTEAGVRATWSSIIVTVKRGSTGPAVRAVQDQLTDRRWVILAVDGVFGARTEAGVREFQRLLSLQLPFAVDGVVGPRTWKALVTGLIVAD
jgi:peptidoglycan hydrolase-like protein with peptidoglycan-binding domain